jgi:membrane-associated phospholipid phosphatase
MKAHQSLARASRRCVLLFGILIFTTTSAAAQMSPTPDASPQPKGQPQAAPTPTLEHEFFKDILRDQRAIFTAPLHISGSDARVLAPLGLATAALIATDQRTTNELIESGDNQSRLRISRDISRIGDFYSTGSIAAALYLTGRAVKNRRARETGLLGAEALIDGGILSTALKAATQRSRPRFDLGRGEFFEGGNSFPSGHAVSAWSLATVVAKEYKDQPLIKYGAYGLATAVSAARYTGRNHFLSDVLIGSAIGYGIGNYVYHTHHTSLSESHEGKTNHITQSKYFPLITPHYNRLAHVYAASLSWNF